MSLAESTASPPHCSRWTHQGNHDWTGTGPGGETLGFSGARSGLFDGQRNSMRLSNTLSAYRRGLRHSRLFAETGYDRLAKRIGYAAEHQTGDPDFDARVYLGTDDPGLADILRAQPGLRAAVIALLDAGAKTIAIDKSGVQATMTSGLKPDDPDGEHDLIAAGDAISAVASLWPERPAPGPTTGAVLQAIGLGWAALVLAAVPIAAWKNEVAAARQIETYAQIDWLGIGVWLGVALVPFLLAGLRRPAAHRTLLTLGLVALVLTPFSTDLLQLRANRWLTRSEADVPAALTELRYDHDDPTPADYEATVTVADRPSDWVLTKQEGDLARQGSLCVAGVVATSLRDLRYVKRVRTWECPGQGALEEPYVPEP
jgi:hypothetical protein